MKKVFIDGRAGTTGLRIYDRLSAREEISLILLQDSERKSVEKRKEAINSADIVFLCLPDAAAIEAAALCENPDTVIIDTSTAHRTDEAWVYGFPELSGKDNIKASKRIANPGCHASGFLALVQPLVKAGILKSDSALSCFSLTGYSGGGNKMIAEYEGENRAELLNAPRQYGLAQAHKHLKEMKKIAGLELEPAFCPVVADFYSGMEVTVPVFKKDLNGGIEDIKDAYRKAYTGKLVHLCENSDEEGFLSAYKYSGKDDMEISVFGNEDRVLLVSRFDNLGKGASGSAIQNMNIVIGEEETKGLKF